MQNLTTCGMIHDMITKKFISNDEKNTIEAHYTSFSLWISKEDIAVFFQTDIAKIQDKIQELEKRIRKKARGRRNYEIPSPFFIFKFSIIFQKGIANKKTFFKGEQLFSGFVFPP